MTSKKILAVFQDIGVGRMYQQFLERKGLEVMLVTHWQDVLKPLETQSFDLILCAVAIDGHPCIQLKDLPNQGQPIPVVLIGNSDGDLRVAVDAMKEGAADFLIPPVRPDDMLFAIETSIAEAEQKRTAQPLLSSYAKKTSDYIINEVPTACKTIDEQIKLVAPTNYSVIIYGESGTGKEMVAREVHKLSQRSNYPFVAIDCGSLTDELANSELFGHEKGAFTGAMQQKIGCFEQANAGTIFLDEIANLPYSIQVSLLRVVQERKIRRVGGDRDIPIDVRILLASNENLLNKCKNGAFREDLYYRLNEFIIELPTLRERKQDIGSFVGHFLAQANKSLKKQVNSVSDEALNALHAYHWPGNLRELKNVIRRAALLADKEITLECLPDEIRNGWIQHPGAIVPEMKTSKRYVHGMGQDGAVVSLRNTILKHEFALIKKTLEENNNNKSKVARLLNIDRKTLYNKIALFNSLSDKEN